MFRDEGTGVADGGDVFMPALWTKRGEWFVYSKAGGPRAWPAPEAWKDKSEVLAYALTDEGRAPATVMPVCDGKIALRLEPAEAFALLPR